MYLGHSSHPNSNHLGVGMSVVSQLRNLGAQRGLRKRKKSHMTWMEKPGEISVCLPGNILSVISLFGFLFFFVFFFLV